MSGSRTNITTATTTVVRTGKGVLLSVIVNKALASGTITLYDNTAGSGTKIGTITNPATLLHSQMVFPYDVVFTTGLTVVTVEAQDITIVWRPQ
jgi:hypothetical protein